MNVEVTTEIVIDRPRAKVAEYACEPDHATEWYTNITEVNWKSTKRLTVGSLVEFTARFLGRRLVYTYEIVELVPGNRLVMRTADGPFPMVTTYEFSDVGTEATRMTLRNAGTPAGFAKIAARGVQRAMRSANEKDLQRLKAVLEASPRTADQ
jgi:uncharacterized protein YndB with AHSA1/START domain